MEMQNTETMLDLNLDIFSSSSSRHHQAHSSRFQQDSSSASYGDNSGDDSNSSSPAATAVSPPEKFIAFGILKKDENAPSQYHTSLTPQLFPAAGKTHQPVPSIELNPDDSGGDREWLNLSSFRGDSNGSELRILSNRNKQPPVVKKSRRGPRSRSSQYRGVTFYRRTGRWESHIWDCGKQVYLGGFDTAYAAARAYDRTAIKFRGLDADINFDVNDYKEDLKKMKHLTKEEFVLVLRRESTGFSRSNSKYALRRCQFLGNKPYDVAAIKCHDMGNEGVIMLGADCQAEQNLELCLGTSSSGDKKAKMDDLYPNYNRFDGSTGAFFGKQPFLCLTMASTKNPDFLTTQFEYAAAASSGFPCFNVN